MTAVVAALFLLSSTASLALEYRFPKQDFAGAIQFVEAEKKSGDIVVTAGAAIYPLQQYYGKTWEGVGTVEELEGICSRGSAVWLIYTFPRYLPPPVSEAIRREFTVVRVFHGTVGDGDVTVARFHPGQE
jgi:hypothetical protein